MKTFVIMIDYGAYEGWKIYDETDSFDEAVTLREQAMRESGGSRVMIFRPVVIQYTEVTSEN